MFESYCVPHSVWNLWLRCTSNKRRHRFQTVVTLQCNSIFRSVHWRQVILQCVAVLVQQEDKWLKLVKLVVNCPLFNRIPNSPTAHSPAIWCAAQFCTKQTEQFYTRMCKIVHQSLQLCKILHMHNSTMREVPRYKHTWKCIFLLPSPNLPLADNLYNTSLLPSKWRLWSPH